MSVTVTETETERQRDRETDTDRQTGTETETETGDGGRSQNDRCYRQKKSNSRNAISFFLIMRKLFMKPLHTLSNTTTVMDATI